MQTPRLSKSEKEIMSILWTANRPLSSAEIIELAGEKAWRSNSIHMFLNNLMYKKMIRVADVIIRGKHACRVFEPIYTETESIVNEIKTTASFQREPIKTATAVFNRLIEELELTQEQREELDAILRGEK